MIYSSDRCAQSAQKYSVGSGMDRVILPFYYNLGTSLGKLTAVPMIAPANATPDEKFIPWRLGNDVHNQLLWLYGAGGPIKAPQVAHDFLTLLTRYGDAIGLTPAGAPPSNVSEASARS